MTQMFELGRILKPQGVRGEVKAELYTDDLSRAYELDHVFLGPSAESEQLKVVRARLSGSHAFLQLEGISDRNEAEGLRGRTLYIDRASAARLPEGACYIQDLLGLPVQDDEERFLGTLVDVMQTGARDVYVVQTPDSATLMFPAIEDVFVTRDPEAGQIIVRARRLAEVAEYDR